MNACKQVTSECSTRNHTLSSGSVVDTFYVDLLSDANPATVFGVVIYLINSKRFDYKNIGYEFDMSNFKLGNCKYIKISIFPAE